MISTPIAFIAAMIKEERSAYDWVRHGNLEPLFITDWEKTLHTFVSEYIRKNGVLPTLELMEDKFDQPFVATAASGHIHQALKDRFIEYTIRESVEQISGKLEEDDNYDPSGALDILNKAATAAKLLVNPTLLINSLKAIPEVWENYQAKMNLNDDEKGLLLGWPSIDKKSGGLEGGDVVSLIGRPATGKTWFMLWLAQNGWQQERRCAFVPMEMTATQIVERQISIQAGIDYAPLKAKSPMMDAQFQKVENWIMSAEGYTVPFFIIDSRMASTVPSIEMYIQAVEADVLYIDGAYLLRHDNSQLNRYQRVAENMDMLKDLAMRLDIPIVLSWQFNRDAAKKFKKKGDETPDLEDIGYSDAIGQHSSIVMGLLQEENLATINKRKIHILKGRGGEQGQFTVAWDFVTSKFGEKDDTIEKPTIFL